MLRFQQIYKEKNTVGGEVVESVIFMITIHLKVCWN